MRISKEELAQLRAYGSGPDKDLVRYKRIIQEKLLANNKIIYLLHNEELENKKATNEEYYGTNILPAYMIMPTQTTVQHYLCYETSFDEVARYNSIIKIQQIIFYVVVNQQDLIEKKTGMPRHDLIAAEIINDFQGKNYFGNQIKLISNKPGVTDNDYATRTLIFEQQATNSLTNNGRTTGLRK